MSDEMISLMKDSSGKIAPDSLIKLFMDASPSTEQFDFIRIFKRAFPNIPLNVVTTASTSVHVIGAGGLDASAVNELLAPWLAISSADE